VDLTKYQFWRALRPFSFTVALVICLTGITSAAVSTVIDPCAAVLVLLAGLLLQAGVNLINDYADRHQVRRETLPGMDGTLALRRIGYNFNAGLCCFLLAAVIGLYLVSRAGLPLLWLALVGIVGALGYTLEPINYKRRGLGVVLVFWLMGVLMVAGSYYAVSGELSATVLWQSLPVSLLTSLLLLSNELRDYEADRAAGIRTLTVRIGYTQAGRLYIAGIAGAFASAAALWLSGSLSSLWPLLPALLCLKAPLVLINRPSEQRTPITPLTGRLFLVFGIGYCLALFV
jgi:1,4-dihydroxy-2-naphthoate octaprenyltransferase